MFRDFVLNGVGHGAVASHIVDTDFDPGLSRPYIDENGAHCVLVNVGTKPDGKPKLQKMLISALTANGMVVNGPTALRKDEWITLDTQALLAYRARLRAYADLSAASSMSMNGMMSTLLEWETQSDPGEAVTDMDALSEARHDAPRFQLEAVPLPIHHAGFWFSARRLAISRKRGQPLNVTMAEACGRRIAEKVERTLIGSVTGLTYGTTADYGRAPTVYGYTNFPARNTYTSLTAPTAGGWGPDDTLAEVLAMRDVAYADNCYGPFMLYHSNDWDQYMDNDYILTGGNVATQTLRNRLRAIEGVSDVRRLDFFDDTFSLLLIDMSSGKVAQAINGLSPTLVQWESQGGARLNFKLLAIQTQRIFADQDGRCGIVHGTTA